MNSLKVMSERVTELRDKLNGLEAVCDNSDKSIELNSLRKQLAVAYNDRALLRYKLVEFDAAIDDYCSAIHLDNTLAIAYYNRAIISYRMSCFDKSVDDLRIALSLEPNNKEFQTAFDDSVKQLNKYQQK